MSEQLALDLDLANHQPGTARVPAMVVLRPGDRVLVALVDDEDEDTMNDFGKALNQSFPGVEFVIMGGVAGLAVQAAVPPSKPVRRAP